MAQYFPAVVQTRKPINFSVIDSLLTVVNNAPNACTGIIVGKQSLGVVGSASGLAGIGVTLQAFAKGNMGIVAGATENFELCLALDTVARNIGDIVTGAGVGGLPSLIGTLMITTALGYPQVLQGLLNIAPANQPTAAGLPLFLYLYNAVFNSGGAAETETVHLNNCTVLGDVLIQFL